MNHFLNNFRVENLKSLLKNQDYIINDLRERLYRLTGCHDFGGCDGTVGSCHYCLEENRELFDKCWDFKYREVSEK